MASTETAPPAPETETVEEAPPAEETLPASTTEAAGDKVEEAPPEVKPQVDAPPTDYLALAELVLRFLVFASAVVGVAVIVTAKQTHKPPSPTAKFNHSPSFIFFVAALSVTGLYSIITTLLSLYALLKPPGFSPKLLSHFVIFDVLLLGIVAAATGSAGAVAYTGLKGNSHLGWGKICNVYDKFCTHVGASVAVSLFASILLFFLVSLSFYSLSKKIPK